MDVQLTWICDPGQVTEGLWASVSSLLQGRWEDRLHIDPFSVCIKVLSIDPRKKVEVQSTTINGNQAVMVLQGALQVTSHSHQLLAEHLLCGRHM